MYLFSNGTIKLANKKFTTLKNDFCIIFDGGSHIQRVKDDGQINRQAFDFTRIGDIEEQVQAKSVDVLGVITFSSETESIKLKDGTMKDKKTVVLADQSMCSISITIWGEEACSKYQFSFGQVVAFKGARISDYNGKSLNAESKQGIFTKVDHPDAAKVKQWFDQHSEEEIQKMRCLTLRMQRDREYQARDPSQDISNKASNLSLVREVL